MNRIAALLAGLITSACCTSLPRLAPKRAALVVPPAPFAHVEEASLDWHDAARGRDVPVRIYTPAGAASKLPVVVFSHGIGEDRDSYAWLGRALARHGFMAVHVTHAGTDRAMLERGYLHLYRAVKEPRNWIARPRDASWSRTKAMSRADADLDRVAVAGHSAGAFTAFNVAGATLADGANARDPRVKKIVAMSMPRLDAIVADWNVAVPVLNITGTCDTSLVFRTFPRHRRIPFERSRGQRLVTIDRVNHDTFSAPADHPLIAALTVAFLLGRTEWFDETGTGELMGTRVAVEAR